jgi:hypothetical protein
MTRRTTRLVAAVLAAGLLLSAGPVGATTDGWCDGDTGVTVVVDFRDLGGATIVRCVPDAVADGFDALAQAGVRVDQPARFPGMVCRLDGKPADDPCQAAPPADAYWAYWSAAPGGDWVYNQRGPASRTPPPGSAEGWSFSTGGRAQPPRETPPWPTTEPTTEPAPAPTTEPVTPSPTPEPPAPSPAPDPVSSAPVAPDPSPVPGPASATDAPPDRTPDPTPDTALDPTAAAPTPAATRTPRPAPSPTTSPDPALAGGRTGTPGGPSTATVVGILVTLTLGLAAAVRARRRRPT